MITTRFAPSPTGKLHIGSVRTALYCYLLARQQGGKYILRVEDTDQARSTKIFEETLVDGFERLELEWDAGPGKDDDKGPYYQMERLDIYNDYLQQLLEKDLAYYARETAEELTQMRQEARDQKRAFAYRRREYSDEEIAQFKEEGRKPVIRFAIEPGRDIVFADKIKGEVRFSTDQIGDFVIVKGDGIPTYHFAVCVDDMLMDVTHVIRGEDHLANTPKHILLFEALGSDLPHFAHLPLMLNPNGKKMSKRDTEIGLVLVDQFRDEGFLPEAVLNFVALLGWNPGDDREFFTKEELIKEFSFARVQSSNAVYDFERARWFNSEYIKNLSDEEFVERVKSYLFLYGDEDRKEIVESSDDDYWMTFAPYIKVRIQTLGQFRDHAKYFFERTIADHKMVIREKMKISKELLLERLPETIHLLEHLTNDQWTEEDLKDELMEFISSAGLKNGQILRPVRAILTAVEASPGAFEMLYILGKEESLVRLREYLDALQHDE